MTQEYKYTSEDYMCLTKALSQAESIANDAPDRYQYHQNELSKILARHMLKPYYMQFTKQESFNEK